MKLIFSAVSFFFNCCVDTTMIAVMSSASSYTFGICKLPYLTDRQFRNKCPPYQSSFGFVCDITQTRLTLTDIANFQKIIDGRFAYCTCRYSIWNNKTVCYNRTITSEVDNNIELDKIRPTTVTSSTSLPNAADSNRQTTAEVLTLSIVYMNFLEKISGELSENEELKRPTWKPNCDAQNKLFPSSILYDYSLPEDQYKKEFLDFHRRMLRSRLKTNSCTTDIIIFAFDDANNGQLPTDDSNLTQAIEDLKRTIQVEISDRAKSMYGDQLTKAVDKINEDYAHFSTAEKIKHLLEQLKTMPANKSDSTGAQGVPRWAIITFVACVCVSILAAFVGSFVTDDSARKRKSSSLTGKNNRKWRAGFSGGMWASV